VTETINLRTLRFLFRLERFEANLTLALDEFSLLGGEFGSGGKASEKISGVLKLFLLECLLGLPKQGQSANTIQ
jgi:hypothetical protein